MIINLTPQFRHPQFTASVSGDVITIDGTPYDFTGVTEGSILPRADEATGCNHFVGRVTRTGGEITLTLIMPCNSENSRKNLQINVLSGAVEIPS